MLLWPNCFSLKFDWLVVSVTKEELRYFTTVNGARYVMIFSMTRMPVSCAGSWVTLAARWEGTNMAQGRATSGWMMWYVVAPKQRLGCVITPTGVAMTVPMRKTSVFSVVGIRDHLCMRLANARRHYNVTSPLFGLWHTQNGPRVRTI